MDSWVSCPPVGCEEDGFKRLRDVGSLVDYLTAGKNLFVLRESGTVVPLLRSGACAPLQHPFHAGAGMFYSGGRGGGGGGAACH